MKYFVSAISIICLLLSCKEPLEEKASIQDKFDVNDIFAKKDSAFKVFISQKIGTNSDYYIDNISDLQKLKPINCDSSVIHYKDEVNGIKIELKLELKPFQVSGHSIKYSEENNFLLKIDNQYPYGGFYGNPTTEIKNIQISINGKEIKTDEYFSNLYNIEMCSGIFKQFSPNPLLTYSKEKNLFQLYVYGGNAADKYFCKFIFDNDAIIKKYMVDYYELSSNSCFYPAFKAF